MTTMMNGNAALGNGVYIIQEERRKRVAEERENRASKREERRKDPSSPRVAKGLKHRGR